MGYRAKREMRVRSALVTVDHKALDRRMQPFGDGCHGSADHRVLNGYDLPGEEVLSFDPQRHDPGSDNRRVGSKTTLAACCLPEHFDLRSDISN